MRLKSTVRKNSQERKSVVPPGHTRSARLYFLSRALWDLDAAVWLGWKSLQGEGTSAWVAEVEECTRELVGQLRARATRENPSAELYFARYALNGLDDLLRDVEQSMQEDEVGAMADDVEAATRKLIALFGVRVPQDAPLYDEEGYPNEPISSFLLARREIAKIARIGKRGLTDDEPSRPIAPIEFAAEAEELRKLRSGELQPDETRRRDAAQSDS